MARIHIEKAEIEKALKIVGTCVVPNRALPISEYIRITTRGDRIKMEAANSGAGIRTYAGMDIPTEDMSFCVNYKDLARYVGAISDDYVSIEVDLPGNCITVMHSGGELAMPVVSAKDFPETDSPGEGCQEFAIPGGSLSSWLQKVKGFAASDPLRPYLNGAHIRGEGRTLSVSASDSKVLFYDSMEITTEMEPFGATIPTATFESIISISEKAETITVITDGKKLWLKSGSTTIAVVLLVGQYPNVRSIIPGQHLFEASVPRKALLDALKRIGLAVGSKSHIIKFTFSDSGVLTILHQNASDMKTASESVSYEGGINFTICFGHEAFIRALSAMESDNVLIRTNDPRHAAVLKEPEGADCQTVLVMPMAVAGVK